MAKHDRIADGGPAFPVPQALDPMTHLGMTLRDYYAGQALAGITASCPWNHRPGASEALDIAGDCYMIADAMLEAREASNG